MRLIVEGQEIRPAQTPRKTASDSIDFIHYQFALPPEWEGFSIVAQFTQGKQTYNVPLTDGIATLPHEIDPSGHPVKLSIFGVKPGEDVRATTIPYEFRVDASGYIAGGVPPVPPPPDLYSRLLQDVHQAIKNAWHFGPENAGMLLYIAADGTPVPLQLGSGLEIRDGALTITNAQAVQAICGLVLAGEATCGEV